MKRHTFYKLNSRYYRGISISIRHKKTQPKLGFATINEDKLTLRELWTFTCFMQADFLTFNLTSVTSNVTFFS